MGMWEDNDSFRSIMINYHEYQSTVTCNVMGIAGNLALAAQHVQCMLLHMHSHLVKALCMYTAAGGYQILFSPSVVVDKMKVMIR